MYGSFILRQVYFSFLANIPSVPLCPCGTIPPPLSPPASCLKPASIGWVAFQTSMVRAFRSVGTCYDQLRVNQQHEMVSVRSGPLAPLRKQPLKSPVSSKRLHLITYAWDGVSPCSVFIEVDVWSIHVCAHLFSFRCTMPACDFFSTSFGKKNSTSFRSQRRHWTCRGLVATIELP